MLETVRGGILREGLGFDACDVGMVTNIGEGDYLGLGWVDTVAELAEVKQAVVCGVATREDRRAQCRGPPGRADGRSLQGLSAVFCAR